MKNSSLRYIFSIILVIYTVFLLKNKDYFSLLNNVTLLEIITSTLIAFIIFAISGCINGFLTFKQYNTKLNLWDVLLLPLMMNFWNFIIPVKGGLIYFISFLKSKYHLRIVKGTSLAIYTQLICLSLIGFLSIIYLVYSNQIMLPVTIVALCLLFSPLLLKTFGLFINKINFKSSKISKLKEFADLIVNESNLPWNNFKTTSVILILNLLRLIYRALWFYWATITFNLNISLTSVFILTLAMELARFLRFSPGNLGIDELLAGGIFYVVGENTETGILIALYTRFSALILTFSLGLFGVLFNMKYFQLKGIKTLWQNFSKEVVS